eukprot:TRINITY_DN8131_c0_g1::TRINITY_DN8131_c0_g1_i1::g.7236::m.7236 TRINITY_DN8131_c0_g1::TRINITY_DN8131_c0_g1_i1::g.7236  ORF type:complete len:672 (+),score=175.08,sp/Q9C6I8/NOG1_ARATH/52.68/0.0,NOG1/PF06858.9/8.8e-29,NOGCT/PF08155.6/4.4e-27,MMR_HSR1/PF01926.18/7.7e-18,FeoB_N/PF02421.13/1.8e-09,Miro/PF08477.8/7e-05,PPV_E1_C/PF00519.12/0.0082,DUF258/PF03193.11/0.019,Dynamin_N/PF00350.18/1.8,Dynamin_N/PF00350.18/26,Dynamin_N/PF00350.18/4.7e+03,RNA_helicase/PF00910.17/49,RNA_helicase/PF00910.17/1.6,Ras
MVVYNFKKIQTVPTAKDFIDIVLSMTQRKTPTVVHKGYKISRIRQFYMRKVKYTQQNYHEKLSQILDDFPRLDDIHPFYADLINVLYDRDHYKLALASLSRARSMIDQICKDYVKLLKYGDSLYRCKMLKRAAMGRMCTLMKKQGASLAYLEQVRQHLSRLPSIDPKTRTLIICGYPNVGKSSFMNKLTRADVEVQPYAFTTKSLFVGHTDYEYLRWQVIDTPGILDHPLEERNTIEMQSITALAHLRASILYFFDISEQCGYSIKQQVALFHSIRPLFANKPLILVINKIDVVPWANVRADDRKLIEDCLTVPSDAEFPPELIQMSNISEEGVMKVKATACDKLLKQRVETKMEAKSVESIVNRLTITAPKSRDSKERPAFIPPSVLAKRKVETAVAAMAERDDMDDTELKAQIRRLERDIEAENGGPGVYSYDLRKKYDLREEDWKYDIIPEIMDGKNVMDYIDPEIEAKLDALEREEEERLAELDLDDDEGDDLLNDEEKAQLAEIRHRKQLAKLHQEINKGQNKARINRRATGGGSVNEFASHLKELGLDEDEVAGKLRERARSQTRPASTRSVSRSRGKSVDGDDDRVGRKRSRSESRPAGERSKSRDRSAYRNEKERDKAVRMAHDAHKFNNKKARRGEADREILDTKPKHLLAGKQSSGTRDRR